MIWYINDARYLPRGTTSETERLNKVRDDKVQFLGSRSPSSPKEISDFRILSVPALRNITFGEELLVPYGNNYKLHE